MLGAAGAWVGFGLQHTANHGGLTHNRTLNALWGFWDDMVGGSSLIWRYHHMVSHHLYTNVLDKDMDVYSSFPLMRFDDRQPLQWFHRFQFIYAPISFSFLYLSAQIQDITCMITEQCYDIRLLGLQKEEKYLFWAGKVLHFSSSLFLPLYLHGLSFLPVYGVMAASGSFILALLFIVSHNIEDTKPSSLTEESQKDWARWQVETSASWGGAISSFFTGGLNFQIEHHLFPGVAHNLYKEIQPIVEDECKKRGIRYSGFPYLSEITLDMFKFMYSMGHVDKSPKKAE